MERKKMKKGILGIRPSPYPYRQSTRGSLPLSHSLIINAIIAPAKDLNFKFSLWTSV